MGLTMVLVTKNGEIKSATQPESQQAIGAIKLLKCTAVSQMTKLFIGQ
jgi:hypothetical protein